ncbi:MAG: glycosyltransferase [Actinobacteria bacterium]|nr:glycosyltransferase [Actinomycetota bacterium]
MTDSVEVDRKRLLFLFSDTGGGHRSATEALIEALDLEFPGRFDSSMVDFFRDYYPRPLNRAPEIYPEISRVPQAWGFSWKATNTRGGSNAINDLSYPYLRKAAKRLVAENPADLIISVHPLVNRHLARAMRKSPRPFITVVTDMVSTHAFWFDRRADLVVVPTEQAKAKAIRYGIPAGNLRVVGLPVAQRFLEPLPDRDAWRQSMGWRTDLPVVLVVGGGDGLGGVKRIAKALNSSDLKATLVVICGRNEELRQDLEAVDWQLPAHIYGFTREMPAFMRAADIMVTKAGPGSISEAFICGLPIVLYSRLPGQEDGNVDYVVEGGAGVWAPRVRDAQAVIRQWVKDPASREAVARASQSLARPGASQQIARLIAEQVGVFP